MMQPAFPSAFKTTRLVAAPTLAMMSMLLMVLMAVMSMLLMVLMAMMSMLLMVLMEPRWLGSHRTQGKQTSQPPNNRSELQSTPDQESAPGITP